MARGTDSRNLLGPDAWVPDPAVQLTHSADCSGIGRLASGSRSQAAQADQVGTRITVAAEAADAYIQVREYQARLAVAQQFIDTDTHLLELVEVRRRAGVADDREVAQAEALLKQAKSTVPSPSQIKHVQLKPPS